MALTGTLAYDIDFALEAPGIITQAGEIAFALETWNSSPTSAALVEGLDVTVTGPITTSGDAGTGILVGIMASAFADSGPVSAFVGPVSIVQHGVITTNGTDSDGIAIDAMAIADAPGGIATASAAGIEVAVDTIHTTGERAPALNINATIAAHGQAGSTATAPSVTVSTTGTLSATGTDAHAINVNIVPDGTNATLIDGDITVDVGAGSALFGGSGDGRAIHITRGDAIVISNRGAISALSGVEWRLPVPPSLSATTA